LPIAAEAPDGAVFFSQLNAKGNSEVWVVDGDTAPAVAEHVAGVVEALAAGPHDLYAATYTRLTAYSRQTGKQVGQWSLPRFSTANTSDAKLVSLSAWDGEVLVSVTMGNNIGIYRVNSAAAAGLEQIAMGTSAAFGPAGSVYFVRADHHLVALSASGVTTVGPVMADKPNGLGGGVQYIEAVAGGLVWVIEPAGQGLDGGFTSYNEATFEPIGHWGGSLTEQVTGTAAGPLVLTGQGVGHCPQPTQGLLCVERISPTGALSDATPVAAAILLMGPDPAVIGGNSADTRDYLLRLG
jgi:hypothetical protein